MNKRIQYSPPAAEIILLAPCEELAVIEKGVEKWFNYFEPNASGGDLGLINAGGDFYTGNNFDEEFVIRFPKNKS